MGDFTFMLEDARDKRQEIKHLQTRWEKLSSICSFQKFFTKLKFISAIKVSFKCIFAVLPSDDVARETNFLFGDYPPHDNKGQKNNSHHREDLFPPLLPSLLTSIMGQHFVKLIQVLMHGSSVELIFSFLALILIHNPAY